MGLSLVPSITTCGLLVPQFLMMRRLACHGRRKVVSSLKNISITKIHLQVLQSWKNVTAKREAKFFAFGSRSLQQLPFFSLSNFNLISRTVRILKCRQHLICLSSDANKSCSNFRAASATLRLSRLFPLTNAHCLTERSLGSYVDIFFSGSVLKSQHEIPFEP